MVNNQITQQEIKKLMEIEGKVIGAVFKTDAEYVREKKGPEGVKALEKATKELGYPIEYDKIKNTEWYPIGLRVISLLAAKKAFNWGDKEIKEMGEFAPRYSFVVKMLLKYFVSIKKVFETCSNYWPKHYSIGSLEAFEINEKEKYAITRLRDIKVHPILCAYITGYWSGITKFVVKSEKVNTEETKCVFKGDPYHEFITRW